ncbi:MAG TPA: mercuric reductase, partial [Trichormus sp.]
MNTPANQPERFEILVLGSGAGGKLLSWHMGKSGARTAMVERRWIGGSCPNVACLPTKNEIWSAKVAQTVRNAADFGAVTGSVTIDMAKVRQRKQDMINELVAIHMEHYKQSGVELILGTGRFVAPKVLEVELNDGGTRLITGDKIFIDTGTHAAIPNIPGLADTQPLTHIEALEVDYLPSHLIVLGGGYIGLELAQAYRRFGSRVTVLERGNHVLSHEDSDVALEIQQVLIDEGIDIITKASPIEATGRSGDKVTFKVHTPSGEKIIEGSDILVSTGRIPNTAGIGLEQAGVQLDDRGYIRVNERLETTAPDVWAIGECAGSPQFTHVSVDDFQIIKANLSGENRSTKNRLVPYCLFTEPQVAHVGLSETEAKRQSIDVRVAKLPMAAVLRTATTGETKGFMKAIISASDDRILGFTMVGSDAGEVMAIVQMAILAGSPYTLIRDAILTHPTTAEGLGSLFANVPPRANSG